jgi:hypothetical protein
MSRAGDSGIFESLLGSSFQKLSPAVRAVHCGRSVRLEGSASVTRGTSLIARILCRLLALPDPQRNAPVTVILEASAAGETWSRWYGSSPAMRSRIERRGPVLVERFGALALHFRVVVQGGQLVWLPIRVTLLGIPLPMRMFSGVAARASEKHGRYAFAVSMSLPIIGDVISYEGVADVIS